MASFIDQIRAALQASPFTPFFVELADGSRCYVDEPEAAKIRPDGKGIFIAQAKGGREVAAAALRGFRLQTFEEIHNVDIKPIRDFLFAAPFRPFELQLADGRKVPVKHREVMLIMPGNKTLVVATDDAHTEYVDVRLVLSVKRAGEPLPAESDAEAA